MTDYVFGPFWMSDPGSGQTAPLAQCRITDPATGQLAVLKDLSGNPVRNPIRSGANSVVQGFVCSLPVVVASARDVTIPVASYKSLMDQALAAAASAAAAQQDGVASGAVTGGALVFTRRNGTTFNVGSVVGPPGPSGSKQQVIDALISAGWPKVVNGATNPAFEVDVSGWTPVGGNLARQTASPPSWVTGTGWARFTTTSGGTRPGVVPASSGDQRINLVGGEWAAVSMSMANAAGVTSQIGLRFFDASNVRLSESMSAAANNTGGRVNHSALAPAGTVYAQPVPYLYNGGTAIGSGVTLDYDDVMLSSGSTQAAALAAVGTSINGSMPNAYWLGTAHGSGSVGVLSAVSRSALPGVVQPLYVSTPTGPALIAYDSGLRNIAATLPSNTYTSGTITLQRTNNEVTLQLSDLLLSGTAAVAGTLDLPILPPGFRPPAANFQYNTVGAVATPVRRLNVLNSGTVRIYSFAPSDLLTGVLKWTTPDSPPTTLPGV
ncbi:hypothetical protein [Arthrobacter woluwensis]|uniref:hypothetical protein n=1 Tax=Arthrobacter woluwensis TaxID=156980 RepID=UPI00119CA09A|nr:hypothetical protein [Arthrobacter woluwensis]